MPPMATTASSKRKWSDVFMDSDGVEVYDKQSLMDLCSSKLRYVNPAKPPRRRTEVPLLRNVLIVNTMKHLSSDLRLEKAPDDFNTSEDLSVDPGHFEGLPPLSELLTDIMLDPQPAETPHAPGMFSSFNWPTSNYSPLTPLEPAVPTYLDSETVMETEEDKVVHDLLPCTSVAVGSLENSQGSSSTWETSDLVGPLDCYISSASLDPASADPLDSLASDLAFQSSSGPLPSFTSLFENSSSFSSSFTPTSSYTDLTPVATASHSSAYSESIASSTTVSSFTSLSPSLNDELVGNTTLTEAELEVLAMAFSSKLPHVSFEELFHAFPQSSRLQQQHHTYQSQLSSYYVPSSIQPTSSHSPNLCGSAIMSDGGSPAAPNNPCGASFCRKDQPQPTVDENMVRVLVNL